MKMTKEERKNYFATLKEAASMVSEDAVNAFLARTAKKYSAVNVSMILAQKPNASVVAGFNAWKEAGRAVRKGEKGIAIYAPLTKKDETDKDDVFGFRVVYVFDITQTEEITA